MTTNTLKEPSVFMRRAWLVFVAALLVRLIILPFSMTTEADAASRVLITEHWMQHPFSVPHEAWPPLHFYLIAAALLVGKDPVLAPILMTMLFSAGTAVVLYAMIRREWGEAPALFVAGAWMFYPVALRYSVMAVSEIPFAFFISLTMLQLFKARAEDGGWRSALWAGFWLTMAGAVRFEAWMLIPLFGLLLWKKPVALFAFLAMASLFPVAWMLRCFVRLGDPFSSFTNTAQFGLLDGINEGLTPHKQIKRAVYLPEALFFGLTPLVSVACIVGATLQAARRGRQRLWLIPFIGMSVVLVDEFITGKYLMMIPRYTILAGLLILPFAAEGFATLMPRLHHPAAVSAFVLATMVPFSYIRHANVHAVAMAVPPYIEAVPRLSPKAQSISRLLNEHVRPGADALILDWWNWSETGYVMLMVRMKPEQIFRMPGGEHLPLESDRLAAFLRQNESGVALVGPKSRFIEVKNVDGSRILSVRGLEKNLRVDPIASAEGFVLYRYRTAEPEPR